MHRLLKDCFPDLWSGLLEKLCEDINLNPLNNHFNKSSLWTENSYMEIDIKCKDVMFENWR